MTGDLAITYPPELPITARRGDLLAAIEANQVLVVAGETGSGKSTQLPKMCLELGRGVDRWIGHTQPRRIAARTIADRIASELDTSLGQTVGYTVRFNDRVGPDTRVKLMTDGILLAEIARDKSLRRYDTIIIDEAHERSLNIDFIVGYLHQLLPRRPDLKVIITSATIDTDRFASHFRDAPVIEVSGRGYPVEIRYEPLDGRPAPVDNRDGRGGRRGSSAAETITVDQTEGITTAVGDLWRTQPGDILVFCSGEREIRDAAEAVADLNLPGAEVLPLYARLSAAEQQRVFRNHDRRRVVIATNVAETSVTVPGIRSVVDAGTARISRYSNRTKVQRLPIEKISQASANQRAGRCGRLGPGVCVRLYGEDDFDARPEFTEPEIQRTNLASVILQMASLGLGEVEDFPFVDPPDRRSVADGVDLLTELDALDPERRGTKKWLTPVGRDLAKLPVDPRYGRMLVEADDNDCLDELLIIVAGLSIQDPRERPSEKRQQADESHRRFADEGSDFLTYLNLWDHLATERRARSRNQFRRMCRREFLNYNRVIEWQDIHTQLRQVVRDLRFRHGGRTSTRKRRRDHTSDRGLRDDIHRSLLVGLLSHIGVKDQRRTPTGNTANDNKRARRGSRRAEYLGARGSRFAIAPGSSLTATSPNWVMAAELVETSRLWARVAAGIELDWVEDLAGHLATYAYGEPWWDPAQGAAMVKERVTLYGLTLAANRAVPLGPVDPGLARELFIHHALVEGDWQTNHDFVAKNRQLFDEIEALETKSRRRDLLVEAKTVHRFFDERLPDHVISTTHFNSWWGQQRRSTPDMLDLDVDLLVDREAGSVDPDAFPDSWYQDDLDLELAYELDPTSPLDGVSVLVPVEVLNQLDPEPFAWTVPGYRQELVGELVRSLPKATRRLFTPLADTVAEIVEQLDPDDGPLLQVLATTLGRRAGTMIAPTDFAAESVPRHLRPTFRVINADYELLAEGKDLPTLKAQLAAEVRSTLATVAEQGTEWDRSGIRQWDFGTLPSVVEVGQIKAYPALVDEGDSVAVRLHASPDEQHDAMWDGVRRLLRLRIAGPARRLDELLPDRTKLQLVNGHVQSKAEWYNDAIAAALDASIRADGGPPWTDADFEQLVARTRDAFDHDLEDVASEVVSIVEALGNIHTRLDQLTSSTYEASVADARAHLARLAYPGFLAGVGRDRLGDVARYLEAISIRLDALAKNPKRDIDALRACRRLENEFAEIQRVEPLSLEAETDREAVMWMLEELRVSLFAQTLRAKGKVSEKRVRRALQQLRSPAAG